MKLEECSKRIDEIFVISSQLLATASTDNEYDAPSVDDKLFYKFRTSSLSFLQRVFGENHTYYIDFNREVKKGYKREVETGIGILEAAKEEIKGGWIFTVKGLVSAEIFSDFLEMSQYLLDEGYKDAAAVIAGGTLEAHIRQLCNKYNIGTEIQTPNGTKSKKTDMMNSDLVKAGAYSKLDQKNVTSWLDLRNKAAHGKYSEYIKDQVTLFISGIQNFIANNPV